MNLGNPLIAGDKRQNWGIQPRFWNKGRHYQKFKIVSPQKGCTSSKIKKYTRKYTCVNARGIPSTPHNRRGPVGGGKGGGELGTFVSWPWEGRRVSLSWLEGGEGEERREGYPCPGQGEGGYPCSWQWKVGYSVLPGGGRGREYPDLIWNTTPSSHPPSPPFPLPRRQTEIITFPHPSGAGGNNEIIFQFVQLRHVPKIEYNLESDNSSSIYCFYHRIIR